VLSLHAIIAAAADARLAPDEADAVDGAYLPICALATLLDGVVDHDRDAATGEQHYIRLYETSEDLERALTELTREAMIRAATVPRRRGQLMTLIGVVAYYATAPGADSQFARPIIGALRAQLSGVLGPGLTLMRRWRGSRAPARSTQEDAVARGDQPTRAAGTEGSEHSRRGSVAPLS
jgi:hypothetical protein